MGNEKIIMSKIKLFAFTVICNASLLIITLSAWITKRRISEEEHFLYGGLTILLVLNIYVLLKSNNKSMENLPGFIGLYLKRRRLEEESKIKEIEK